MKYTPKELTDNVNVPKVHPLRELVVLLGGVIGLLLVAYLLLGVLVDVVVGHLSPATEQKIEQRLSGVYARLFASTTAAAPAETELQQLLEQLQQAGGQTQQTYRVVLVDNPTINALALPGGRVVVFAGLLAAVESENELAMVLAHELGHFAHRDHLRGLGRGVVLLTLSTILLGGDDPVSGLLQNSLAGAEMKFSQHQELAADAWGLKLIAAHYGHAGGCTDFFRRMQNKEKLPRWTAVLASHPHGAKRVTALEQQVADGKLTVAPLRPLPAALRTTGETVPPRP